MQAVLGQYSTSFTQILFMNASVAVWFGVPYHLLGHNNNSVRSVQLGNNLECELSFSFPLPKGSGDVWWVGWGEVLGDTTLAYI